MKQVLFILFAMFFLASSLFAQKALVYGDIIHLQNVWNDYQGGFLDVRKYDKDVLKTGNHLAVSTSTNHQRDGGSGSWKIISASGKKDGTPVLVGDAIFLLNAWNGFKGGYLDTRGYDKDFGKTGNHLAVSTANSNNRDGGSGTWKITSASNLANGTALTENSLIYLQNGWNKYQGGFLDTRNYDRDCGKTGNHLAVSTATSNKRAGGTSGTWKIIMSSIR